MNESTRSPDKLNADYAVLNEGASGDARQHVSPSLLMAPLAGLLSVSDETDTNHAAVLGYN